VLWFAWDGTSLWLYSITRSRRWADQRHDPRVAVVVDDGEEYGELRGVELSGSVDFPEPLFAAKNFGLDAIVHDGRHAWLRLNPETVTSWDFRKIPQG
jgi:hypothetical protein